MPWRHSCALACQSSASVPAKKKRAKSGSSHAIAPPTLQGQHARFLIRRGVYIFFAFHTLPLLFLPHSSPSNTTSASCSGEIHFESRISFCIPLHLESNYSPTSQMITNGTNQVRVPSSQDVVWESQDAVVDLLFQNVVFYLNPFLGSARVAEVRRVPLCCC
jgi:hypothetical protein